ncbi:putative C6 transcription factor [Pseudovirgaria hyperparasitica]|uniref:Putative C6 transcription factor n=1 Tax=Pseudovirgaria hyperparasitica TaxID=470096 RepID=A0A6A6W5N9_9PEZI|nr:putative C6 transcription factor [Pseudovirgaria hyperparasitica]KAF2756371.1 putative C6 transcription factor [Pseudovirgaria hyperparasitica]
MLSPEDTHSSFSSPSASSARPSPKRQRVLACVLCQQRKVKCDRIFPCSNCSKAGVQCVPSSLTRPQRKRRFPERELLDRLRHYENLLRRNGISFEPIHPGGGSSCLETDQGCRNVPAPSNPTSGSGREGLNGELESLSRSQKDPEVKYNPRSMWQLMGSKSQDEGDTDELKPDCELTSITVGEKAVRSVWDQLYKGNDNLLFALPDLGMELYELHPDQVQIFRLWQIYLDNVCPLLRVTHTSSLQVRIIDAVEDLNKIDANLEALMFSIYAVATMTLTEAECRTSFGEPKKELLATYHRGLQQALRNSDFLQSKDRDCLTAILLYLISIRSYAHPRSVSTMLGIAMRMAQRMGIHNEAQNSKQPAMEAEMRRRLWWALVIFDSRISDLADAKTTLLIPTWDCRLPLNANDSDLRPEMKNAPVAHMLPTEALFIVVRCKISDYLRHSPEYLEFVDPVLKRIAEDLRNGPSQVHRTLESLEREIEEQYLRYCNPENPLHFVTIWMSRCLLAKSRLLEIYLLGNTGDSLHHMVHSDRDAILTQALRMLECDTKLAASPLIKGYTWLLHLHFQAPAYIITMQDLARRPTGEHADRAWAIMNDNYAARFSGSEDNENMFSKLFANIILHAWHLRTAKQSKSSHTEIPPSIVMHLKEKMSRSSQGGYEESRMNSTGKLLNGTNDLAACTWEGRQLSTETEHLQNFDLENLGNFHTEPSVGLNFDQLDWMSMDWNVMHGSTW